MDYQYLDMETYKRKRHFEYFNSLAFPYVGVTVNVDITDLLKAVKAGKLPFFLSICYCVSRAANRVPEFRQRILDGQIIEYDYCLTSHTIALSDGTYCYCDLDSNRSFEDYIRYGANEQETAKQKASINEEADDALGKIFISTIPWISYTALINPTPVPADSNPRITWGKYFAQDSRVLLPVSVLCHHALVDGLHIAQFYDFLGEECKHIVTGGVSHAQRTDPKGHRAHAQGAGIPPDGAPAQADGGRKDRPGLRGPEREL